ncbi:hypothetical protein GBA52_013970 [Prunus armeniaca]|nr:hypothetical protein GBA52_013970 [Prunus armeniaca]
MNHKECRTKCLKNCSCMAYRNSDIRGGGTGCAIWFGDLIDVRQFTAAGQDLYIQMSASELAEFSVYRPISTASCNHDEENGSKLKTAVANAVSVAMVLSEVLLVGYYLHRSRRKLKGDTTWTRNCCEEAFKKFWPRIE